ncbi:MAG: response regulator, partial [Proteobacteria bacterium]|nr:response regulator [Pseudomonadota bacterium]
YAATTLAWSTAGAILWSQSHMASQLAAAGVFAGQLAYLSVLHGRSMGALIPVMPALSAPAIAPLAIPHFHGLDQLLAETAMLAAVGQAAIGVAVAHRQAKQTTASAAAQEASAADTDISDLTMDLGLARPLRVLAAEDNPVNQLVLRTLLAQVGVAPVLVADGRAAIEAWAREPWDLILMDAQMPGMDGATAAREIRSAEARSDRVRTPIVALTAGATRVQLAALAAAGMDAHVEKPMEPARLFEALKLGAIIPAAGTEAKAA